jgi:hypothetical protein
MELRKTQMSTTSYTTNITPDMTTKKDQTPAPKPRKRKSPNLDPTTVPPRAPSLPNKPPLDPKWINPDGTISF